MEEFLSEVAGGAVWGVGFGLALGAVRASRPIAKTAIVGAVGVSDWLRSATAETRERFEDMYHEARAEIDATDASTPS